LLIKDLYKKKMEKKRTEMEESLEGRGTGSAKAEKSQVIFSAKWVQIAH
jgi:hypothetical protein